MVRTVLSTLPGKLAAAAAGLTFATTGLAAASALPGPLQQVVSDVGGIVGVDLPVGDVTAPIVDVTVPITEGTTPTTGVTTPTTTPSTDGTGTTPTTGSTPQAAATTAAQAAQIHDFDEACGNHGAYVSFVARNGTEPSCAAEVRSGTSAPTVTVPKLDDDDSGDDVEAPEADHSGRPTNSGKGSGSDSGRSGDSERSGDGERSGDSGSKGSSGH